MTEKQLKQLMNNKKVQQLGKNAQMSTRKAVALRLLLLEYGRIMQAKYDILIDELTDEELLVVTIKLQKLIDSYSKEKLDSVMSATCNRLIEAGFSMVDLAELITA